MIISEILKELFFIKRGYLNANHFVYRSKAPILIDTGYISDFNETEKLLSKLGVNLSDVSLIINTHTHCDHIGGNQIIQKMSGCDIALHEVGKYFIDTLDDWSTWWKYFNQEADFFNCTQSLEDGDIIFIGPNKFKVIYTPGHASDGIVLYNRQEKILISSDTLWETDVAAMTLRIEGSRALFHMQESLQKIESLEVNRIYPGHGKPFNDLKKAILKSKKKIKRCLLDRELIGNDLIKKIIVYTLLMKKSVKEDDLFPSLMDTIWFKETIDLYFNNEYELKYNEIMATFIKRGVVRQENGNLYTTVTP